MVTKLRTALSSAMMMALTALGSTACGQGEVDGISLSGRAQQQGPAGADGGGAGGLKSVDAKPVDPKTLARPDGPKIGAVQMAVSIFERPDPRSAKIGYLRVGALVPRAEKPAAYDGCQGGFYQVLPRGYVCAENGATTDMSDPLLRAEIHPPQRDKPMPYTYGFVRAIAPRYYRLPTEKEQLKYEMSLKRHLRSYRRLQARWNRYGVGSNDVRILEDGVVLGPPPEEAPNLNRFELFGGDGVGSAPWFFDGGRQIPNIASFKVPDYAVITDRIKRHAGVALLDAFAGEERDFALTTDLRLLPLSKLKPARGSLFHGVELTEGWELPLAFVKRKNAREYERRKGRYKKADQRHAYGTPIQLTGEARRDGGRRYLETDEGTWMRSRDLAIVAKVSKLPRHAREEAKWIDISILRQTLILYQGSKPLYATMVSTGKDGLGDPRKSHSTPLGTFRIRDKHVTTAMDSQVLGEEFELNDVPWVQYFKAGYALHAAYWHTDYGRPRSHGCINLAPIDAYRIFKWTGPSVPAGWHGVFASKSAEQGTRIHIHR